MSLDNVYFTDSLITSHGTPRFWSSALVCCRTKPRDSTIVELKWNKVPWMDKERDFNLTFPCMLGFLTSFEFLFFSSSPYSRYSPRPEKLFLTKMSLKFISGGGREYISAVELQDLPKVSIYFSVICSLLRKWWLTFAKNTFQEVQHSKVSAPCPDEIVCIAIGDTPTPEIP